MENCRINNYFVAEGLIQRAGVDDLNTYHKGSFLSGNVKLAIKTGKLEIVKLVHDKCENKTYASSFLQDCLIYHSMYPDRQYIEIFMFLADHCPLSESTIISCLSSGVKEIVEFACENKPATTKRYFHHCIEESDVAKNYPHLWNGTCSREAAKYGRIDLLKWAFSNNLKISKKVLVVAATEGKIDIVVWYVHEILGK